MGSCIVVISRTGVWLLVDGRHDVVVVFPRVCRPISEVCRHVSACAALVYCVWGGGAVHGCVGVRCCVCDWSRGVGSGWGISVVPCGVIVIVPGGKSSHRLSCVASVSELGIVSGARVAVVVVCRYVIMRSR